MKKVLISLLLAFSSLAQAQELSCNDVEVSELKLTAAGMLIGVNGQCGSATHYCIGSVSGVISAEQSKEMRVMALYADSGELPVSIIADDALSACGGFPVIKEISVK